MKKRLVSIRPKMRKRILLSLLVFFTLVIGIFVFWALQYAPVLFQLLFQKDIELKKTTTTAGPQRINILLLGIGGGKHEGPNLSDTIIFASLDPTSKKATLVSIPRDLWISELSAKINTAYAYGEEKQKGGGLMLAKAVVQKVLGQEVDYGIRVDFNGFVRAVDMVGGLDIDVERTFDDYEYPITGKEADDCGYKDEEFAKRATDAAQLAAFPCRYEHLHFDQGVQHTDGETALKFVRSRHALGSEGTDFARSKRQEKVISAFREKVFSAGTFLNPIKVISLYTIFKDSIDTDIKQEEFDDFIKLARKMESAEMKSIVLDVGDADAQRNGLLINPPITKEYRNAWVIIPRVGNGNYSEIHEFVDCEIRVGNCAVTPTKSPSL